MELETRSPYERALGSQLSELHPVLQRYFAAIPAGSVGIGEGIFERFGTERWWLRPLLGWLARRHVIVPGMHHKVPFRIENRTVAGHQTAARTLELESGTWTMVDAVSLSESGQVVDVLGRPALVEAAFDVAADDGGLSLSSRGVTVRLGAIRLSVPKVLRPVIALSERFDAEAARQYVRLTVDVPVLGRVYEYTGSFTYRIEKET
ncbi:DUF4166 domain-containing protein [Brevibacterium sp. UCMA 11754]|uniref:DUF4166 domain-containing protein n=1 Tax=Brevibacterium sp. UCMA 11754 TaxID=2749198 RepID=UPI001F1E7999|nr:DUF4166 domain-containing protein [Brevibacterium sp. UCMA 11754]MCF2570796.1 DUF4166 domain-containing protein [Brevibacterium sp. UCMA 11754]